MVVLGNKHYIYSIGVTYDTLEITEFIALVYKRQTDEKMFWK